MSWNLNTLEQLLSENQDMAITKEDGCIRITNDDGIDAYLAVSGEQIIVESLLFAKSQVMDTALLNEEILKTHQVFPLTTMGMTQVGGEDYYMAFGALSSQSKEESILLEIQMLFQNIEGFLDAYQDHLK
ncbi:YjfI family protein [Alkalimarinus alittae]|uniref:YjfI family protein n=1 Tax=Alkalimarinus alittae TaxID=2961619 RepID=A0ABY6N5T5_9ALTE|nr:YjfI family protein [Alkalimarinus alittae]UZE97352.1 YjfI family protein [Alkalimarinus alittae]